MSRSHLRSPPPNTRQSTRKYWTAGMRRRGEVRRARGRGDQDGANSGGMRPACIRNDEGCVRAPSRREGLGGWLVVPGYAPLTALHSSLVWADGLGHDATNSGPPGAPRCCCWMASCPLLNLRHTASSVSVQWAQNGTLPLIGTRIGIARRGEGQSPPKPKQRAWFLGTRRLFVSAREASHHCRGFVRAGDSITRTR